jgi:hypothetical protein
MGAADGTLQQIAVGLAERPENISFISHVLLPVLNFFLQKQINGQLNEKMSKEGVPPLKR